MFFCNSGLYEIAKSIRESTHELLYKRIPKKPNKDEIDVAKRQIREINESRMLLDSQRIMMINDIYLNLISEEVER